VSPILAQFIVDQYGGHLRGNPASKVSRLANLELADGNCLSFFSDPKRKTELTASRAAVIVIAPGFVDLAPIGATLIITPNPYLYFAKVTALFAPVWMTSGIHPSAVIDKTALVGANVAVGPNVVIGAHAQIGDNCVIDANCVVGSQVKLGEHVILFPSVTLYSGVQLGARSRIHSGTVLGSDGFGYAPNPGQGWVKIEQLGSVVIGCDVEIGANCTIDRGALTDTIIGDGCKLDNQIQVAHGVQIGARTAIAACVGIAGSAIIGADCAIGGAAGVLGHLSVCDGVIISAMSLVTKSIREPGMYTGVFPLQSNRDWERSAVLIKQLDDLRHRIKALESKTSDKPTQNPT
jgi:UDP-3-O-[3-hydroxymyristoyl] glucosamine N-acyltransferase